MTGLGDTDRFEKVRVVALNPNGVHWTIKHDPFLVWPSVGQDLLCLRVCCLMNGSFAAPVQHLVTQVHNVLQHSCNELHALIWKVLYCMSYYCLLPRLTYNC